MRRPVDDIVVRADEFAARFEDYEPRSGDELDLPAVRARRDVVAERSTSALSEAECLGRHEDRR